MALYLLVRIAGQRVALPCDAIESVVELDAVTLVPRVPPHVAGLAALRSRLVTVIDVRVAIGMASARQVAPLEAVVVTLDGHSYGLVVEGVEDVAEADAPEPLQVPLADAWRGVANQVVEIDGELLLVVDPVALIVPQAAAA